MVRSEIHLLKPQHRDRKTNIKQMQHICCLKYRGIERTDMNQITSHLDKSQLTNLADEIWKSAEWVAYLRDKKLWGNDDPLFPATKIALGPDCQFKAAGLTKNHWSNATPIRKIFREAFDGAGLPYFNPHSFRNTLVRLGEQVCKTPEDFKAWSQNLGHEKVLTTLFSYGTVAYQRQGEIIKELGGSQSANQTNVKEFAEALLSKLRESGIDVVGK